MIELHKAILSSEKDIVALRNKTNDALLILTGDQMFSTQKASFLSYSLKKVLRSHQEISCTVSMGTNNAFENNIEVELFSIDSSSESNEKSHSPIEKLSYRREFDLDKIDAVKKIFEIKSVDELLVDIQHKNVELENSLQNLRAAKDLNARMESELEVGQSIQMGMLPKERYISENIQLFAKLIPAREVGGDFYDFFEIDHTHLGIVMGDVSGKGVPAALMMAVCKTLLKAESTGRTSSAEVITRVNNTMSAENTNYMFVTIFMGILNTKTGKLVYTNAGHCPTYVSRTDGTIEKLSEVHGPAVAAMEGLTYREASIDIFSGDKVVAYTDGIPEAHDMDNNLYGDTRLENLIKENEGDPETLADEIIHSVIEYEKGTERFDDLTILCMEYMTSSESRRIYTVKYDITSLRRVLEHVEQFLMERKVQIGFVSKVQIALDEVISNIIKYSSIQGHNKLIGLEVVISNNSIYLIVKDSGIEFNPLKKEQPNVEKSLVDRKVGGLGIHITKSIMSDLQYERVNNENILRLRLDLD